MNSAKDHLAEIGQFNVGDSSVELYDRWAEDYEADLVDRFGYCSPELVADTVKRRFAPNTPILEYGCGTGLVGQALSRNGFHQIVGIDISAAMLARAGQKSVYRKLIQADLTEPLSLDWPPFPCAVCVGSMGAGHLDECHVAELLKPLTPNGVLIIYMNDRHFEAEGFAARFEQLEKLGLWRIESLEKSNYMSALERPGWLIVARVRRPVSE